MKTLSLIPVLAVLALSSSPAVQADTKADLQQSFSEYNDRYNKLVSDYDLEAFIALYNDAPVWIAPTEAPVAGLDVPRNTFQFIIEKEGQLTHTFDHLFVSDDETQAVMIGQYDATIAAVGAKSTGTYLFVLERQGDYWKIVVDMFNEHKEQ